MKDVQMNEPEALNRTGIMTNPILSAELIEGTKKTVPSSKGNGAQAAANRAAYLEEASPIGSKPMASNGESEIDTADEAQPEAFRLLLDKLGERLAFERQGSRLYETVVQKFESLGDGDGGGPSLKELRHIYEEELQHFKLLQKAVTDMGGDATVQTPSADVAGVLSQGILQIVTDPRTTRVQTLQAMLNAELADNDGWQMLINLSSALGHTDFEKRFEQALEEEQEHLENVRRWLEAMTLLEAEGVSGNGRRETSNGARKQPKSSRSTKRKKKK
jgi:hypothetical protein